MQSVRYKLTEFFLIFIILPVSFALDYPFVIKAFLAISGFGYVSFVLLKVEDNKFKMAPNLKWKSFWKHVFIKLLVIAFLTIGYMFLTAESELFHVVQKTKTLGGYIVRLCHVFSLPTRTYLPYLIFSTLQFAF